MVLFYFLSVRNKEWNSRQLSGVWTTCSLLSQRPKSYPFRGLSIPLTVLVCRSNAHRPRRIPMAPLVSAQSVLFIPFSRSSGTRFGRSQFQSQPKKKGNLCHQHAGSLSSHLLSSLSPLLIIPCTPSHVRTLSTSLLFRFPSFPCFLSSIFLWFLRFTNIVRVIFGTTRTPVPPTAPSSFPRH